MPRLFPQTQLCLPDSLDTLSQANVVRLKLVKADTDSNSSSLERPHEELLGLGRAPRGKVVDDA